jgi:hypothetical protein
MFGFMRFLGVFAIAWVSACETDATSLPGSLAGHPATAAAGESNGGADAAVVRLDDLDRLVGKWVSREAPAVNLALITLTLNADRTLEFIVDFEPWTTPAGSVRAKGCVTLGTFEGTYAESVTNGTNVLAWMFTAGSSDQVAHCDDSSLDRSGTPITDVTDIIRLGRLPPTTVNYAVTSTSLTLSPPYGITFTRAP